MSTFKTDNNFNPLYQSKDEYATPETPLVDIRLSALQAFVDKRNELFFDYISKEANIEGQNFVDYFFDERMNDTLFTKPVKEIEEILTKLGIDNLKAVEFVATINAVRDAYGD